MGVVAVVSTEYDEGAIKARLDDMSSVQRVLFACACAERLFPLYELFVSKTGQGDADQLRRALDMAWSVQGSVPPGGDLDRLRASVEELVPHDDEAGWFAWSPFAQNAAASVAYALRAWLSSDSQNGVWAARQLYEAADYLLQLSDAADGYVDEGAAVLLAVQAISSALVSAGTAGVVDLKSAATSDGKSFRNLAEETESS